MKKIIECTLKSGKAIFTLLVLMAIIVGSSSCKKDDPVEPAVTKYKVTYVRNNGQTDSIVEVTEGSKLKKPVDPVKTGAGLKYSFENWYKTVDLSGDAFDFANTKVMADMSLYAKYNEIATVTFHTLKKDGSADSTFTQEVVKGENAELATLPIPRKESENKLFNGWFTAPAGGTEFTGTTVVNANIDVYYQLVQTNYKLFDIDDVNRTLTIGGYIESSPDQITNVVNFAPPAKIGVYKIKQIGRDFFYPVDDGSSNTTLTTIVVPEGVEEIIGGVFRNCAAVTSVTLPSTLKKLDGAVFWGNSVKNLVIPDGPTSIPTNFAVASLIETITFPSTLTEIGNAAFAHCDHLKSLVFPDNLIWIGHDAFGSNDALESISWNVTTAKLDSLAGGAFYDCINLTSITFPNSLRVIGGYGERNMFINNVKLTTVTIPANVQRLGGGAFALCDMLTEVIFLGNTPPWMEDAMFNKREGTPWVTIKVPAAALQTYLDACQPPYTYGEDWKWWNSCCGQIIASAKKSGKK
ncbi:MAG: leucine-rich repeat protein [Bacteroidales bacterium]